MQACAALLMTSLLAVAAEPPGAPAAGAELTGFPGPAAAPACDLVPPAAGGPPPLVGPDSPPVPGIPADPAAACHRKMIWGEVDAKVFPDAGRIAPNGVSYGPLFSLDLDLNIWLWREHGVYLFADARYWGGRGGQGQTHGNFDYTRREFDFSPGVAWNYYGPLELRAVGYAHENFNRGTSQVSPNGNTNDGMGAEQRLYLSDEYARLGQDGYNVSRATFVSVGYYPTKSMIGGDGKQFKPGLFGHAYLTWDIPKTCCYLFGDVQLMCSQSFTPRRLDSDVGLAIAPFEGLRMLEFRLGSEFNTDLNASGAVRNMSLPYVSMRLNY
jgi:hypothetical protein